MFSNSEILGVVKFGGLWTFGVCDLFGSCELLGVVDGWELWSLKKQLFCRRSPHEDLFENMKIYTTRAQCISRKDNGLRQGKLLESKRENACMCAYLYTCACVVVYAGVCEYNFSRPNAKRTRAFIHNLCRPKQIVMQNIDLNLGVATNWSCRYSGKVSLTPSSKTVRVAMQNVSSYGPRTHCCKTSHQCISNASPGLWFEISRIEDGEIAPNNSNVRNEQYYTKRKKN